VNPGLAKAMHAQSGAEREKRARIIVSEGERTSTQNYSEGNTAINPFSVCNSFRLLPGKRQSDIKQSEGARQQAINIAEGLYVSNYSFFIQQLIVYTGAHFLLQLLPGFNDQSSKPKLRYEYSRVCAHPFYPDYTPQAVSTTVMAKAHRCAKPMLKNENTLTHRQ
jgi:hypothetical protein